MYAFKTIQLTAMKNLNKTKTISFNANGFVVSIFNSYSVVTPSNSGPSASASALVARTTPSL